MKKEVSKIFIVFLLIIISSGLISAESCSVIERENCNGNIIMGLSSETNAHGELANQENYDYVLCCDFGTGNTNCNGKNKIIGLSSETNAHAEITEEENYEEDVCYEGLDCTTLVGDCNEDYPLEVLSLSQNSNAHLGKFSAYPTKICCKVIECPAGVNYCRDYNLEFCSYDPCNKSYESVEKNNPKITCGDGYYCSCEVFENPETFENQCVPSWDKIEQPKCGNGIIDKELGETCDGENIPYTECNGNVGDCSGGTVSCYPAGHEKECTLEISGCSGCSEDGICGDGIINNFPSETCDTTNLDGKSCEDFGLSGEGLSCFPAENDKACNFDTTGCERGADQTPSGIGKCIYEETTNDDCEDGFLTYSWTATWIWNEENSFDSNLGEGYVLGDDEKWHYDPNNAQAKCSDDSNTVPCPAQVQLPFFGEYSILIIVIAIILIYIILKYKNKYKKSSKKQNPKKKTKKTSKKRK